MSAAKWSGGIVGLRDLEQRRSVGKGASKVEVIIAQLGWPEAKVCFASA